MEIKKILKNLDVKISRLAKDLNISRPTLDTYIEYYEAGKPIPNNIYKEVFDYLFVSEDMTNIEFAKRFDYVKRTLLGDYKDNQKVVRENKLRENISDFALSDNADSSLLEFLNLFINNRKLNLVQAICNYFNYVNGIKEYDESSESQKDKALYSMLFKIFADYKNETLDMVPDSYNSFKEKNIRILEKKKNIPTDEQLIEYIQSQVEENATLDIEYIKQLLNNREK